MVQGPQMVYKPGRGLGWDRIMGVCRSLKGVHEPGEREKGRGRNLREDSSTGFYKGHDYGTGKGGVEGCMILGGYKSLGWGRRRERTKGRDNEGE